MYTSTIRMPHGKEALARISTNLFDDLFQKGKPSVHSVKLTV
nr:hypothetical protein [Marinilactibacillus kalidii]